jgi:colanic acid/amylovoran biosynthesis glycosyltransferase
MYVQKTNKTLFLLTKTFPFGNGEQYITNELTYLSKVFEKIIIYPNDYYGDIVEHDKQLPSNVVILNFNKMYLKFDSKSGLADYLFLIKTTINEVFETNDKKSFFNNFKWNLINFWTQLKLANSFEVYLDKNNLNDSIFYSYWFHKSAILLAILKSKNSIRSFASRAHSVDLYHNAWGIINESVKVPPYKMFKLKQVTTLYAVSQHGYKFLCDTFPKLKSNFDVSYLGVEQPISVKEQSSVDKPFHIVTCSGLDANKRVHLLAKAIIQLKCPVRWTHFGDGVFKPEIEKLKSGISNGSMFDLKGQVSNVEVTKFYASQKVDLFVNLSVVEGLPVSILEAMAFEIPILATAVYGTPEAVIENKNGFLLDVNFTIAELLNKLNYCINNKDELKTMGRSSRSIYQEKFNANTNYSEFAKHLVLM